MAAEEPTDLDWVQLRKEIGNAHHVETFTGKFQRKFFENPFIPIGCLATATALGFGLWSFRSGKPILSQKMMRARIAAQGFTIAALVIGVIMKTGESKEQK